MIICKKFERDVEMKRMKKFSMLTLSMLALVAAPTAAFAEGGQSLGDMLPIWSIIPFVGMLLSIAIFPLVNAHWWEHNQGKVAVGWALVFLVPFFFAYGANETIYQLIHSIILDYVPFLILLFALYAVAGGIVMRGSLVGTPKVNAIILLIGTILASVIGTTGAAMLLIRPLLRANEWRKRKLHSVIFFIFLVCNIGGCLTPVGDPPLFMGFLRGIPFFWTTIHLMPLLIFNSIVLFAVYFVMETRAYKKDLAEGLHAPEAKEKITVEGLHNLLFIALILFAVVMSGILQQVPMFLDASGHVKGIHLFTHNNHAAVYAYPNLLRDIILLIAAYLSMKTTSKASREYNNFNWGAIEEVAKLFFGIFITMIPALALLGAHGADLGIDNQWKFFWATGLLSGFLDNTPTYLVFLTTAVSLGTEGMATTIGTIEEHLLMAVSAGAVFMGALSYIGNAPNFMVRSIADENNVKMPSFFGYMAWSFGILVPLFVLDTIIFFL